MATATVHQETRRGTAALLLAQLGRMATRRLRAALAPTGLAMTQVAVLLQIRDHGPTTQQDLAAALDIDPGSLVAVLNDVEASGLAVRRRDPSDRRRHIVAISERGADRLAGASRKLAGAEERLLGDLADEERLELYSLLTRVADKA